MLRRQQLARSTSELQPDDQRLDPAEHQEGESGDDVADADLLVVDRRQPADQAGLRSPIMLLRALSQRGDLHWPTDGTALIICGCWSSGQSKVLR